MPGHKAHHCTEKKRWKTGFWATWEGEPLEHRQRLGRDSVMGTGWETSLFARLWSPP